MSDLKEVTGSLLTRDGLRLFYRKFEAENPVAGIVFAHGLGEHSGRYNHLVEHLLPKGYSFWLVDHRGHGKSEGTKGHVMEFDNYLMDLSMVVEMARNELGEEKKLFLIGHSMGGLITISFALKYTDMLDGIVVSSPALGMKVKVPAIKEKLGLFMSKVWPSLTMANELPKDKISHDEEVVRDYENDPLVHSKVSARWFTEFIAAIDNAHHRAGTIKMPVLMQVAGDDYLVNAPSSKEWFGKLSVEDRTLHYYDGNYHENYHEVADRRTQAFSDLEAWLKDHVK